MLDGTAKYLGEVLARYRDGLRSEGIVNEPMNPRVPLREFPKETIPRNKALDCGPSGKAMEQATVSQHLGVLRTKLLVLSREAGNQVFYSVRDPIIVEVLNLMRPYFHVHLKETMGMLDEMEKPQLSAVVADDMSGDHHNSRLEHRLARVHVSDRPRTLS